MWIRKVEWRSVVIISGSISVELVFVLSGMVSIELMIMVELEVDWG